MAIEGVGDFTHLAQKTCPQFLQWCFRSVSVNFRLQPAHVSDACGTRFTNVTTYISIIH